MFFLSFDHVTDFSLDPAVKLERELIGNNLIF